MRLRPRRGKERGRPRREKKPVREGVEGVEGEAGSSDGEAAVAEELTLVSDGDEDVDRRPIPRCGTEGMSGKGGIREEKAPLVSFACVVGGDL